MGNGFFPVKRRVSLGAWSENASEVCVVLFGNGCGSWVRRGEMRGGGDFSVVLGCCVPSVRRV